VLFPALRLGYLVVPPPLIDVFVRAKSVADRQASVLEQAVLAAFIAEGHFSRHLRRMRLLYRTRQHHLVAAARRALVGLLEVHPADAGMHVVGWLPAGADDAVIARRARQHGLMIPPLSFYRLEAGGRPGLVLGYPAYNEAEIDAGVRRLAGVLGA
jgi:GntR family transcriptional regulator/MocR family aminotransferase